MNRFYKFLRLNENIDIEEKVFSIIIFFSFIISIIFVIITLFIFTVFYKIAILQSISGLIFLSLSYQIHFRKIYKPYFVDIFIFSTLAVMDTIYFSQDGVVGSASLILVLLSVFGILLQRGKAKKNIFIVTQIANFFIIYGIQKLYPEIITPYKNLEEKEIDFLSTGFIAILFCCVLLKFFKDSYDLDRKQILDSKEKLQELFNELEIEKNKSEELAKVKSNFLANMSHEIRTPLNGIIGMTELYFLTDSKEEKNLSVQTVQSSSNLLLSIVNDILDFSKIEAGKLILESKIFSIEICLAEILKTFNMNSKIYSKTLVINFEIDSALDQKYVGDEFRLKQVLLNLISNAIKFTERGSVKIKISKVKDLESSTEILFEIIDTGIGISDTSQLFQVFTQADSSITRKYGGTGLGLSISKSLIELMEGKIQVTSRLGEGSTFSFAIILQKSQNLNSEVKLLEVFETHFQNTHIKILLVEDNAVNQLVFAKFMGKLKIPIDIVGNGKLAVDKVASNQYDIIFMDMNMPIMDGIEATKIIRKSEILKQPVIISLTANVIQEEKQKCLDAGMDDFMTKPYTLEQIKEKILKYTIKK